MGKPLGLLIKEARERSCISKDAMSSALGVTLPEYEAIEAGMSDLEEWGPILASIAVKTGTPTSRLISRTGQSAQADEEPCGTLIRQHRENKEFSQKQLADLIGVSEETYQKIERGVSPIEEVAHRILQCAETLDLPVFNLLYAY